MKKLTFPFVFLMFVGLIFQSATAEENHINLSETKHEPSEVEKFQFTQDIDILNMDDKEVQSGPQGGSGGQTSEWVNYLQTYADFEFFDPNTVFTRLFPDSTVQYIGQDQGEVFNVYNGTHAQGVVFDPFEDRVSEFYLREGASFSIEGIRFPYYYEREIDEFTTYDSTFTDSVAYNFTVNSELWDSVSYMNDTTYYFAYDETEEKYNDTIGLDPWEVTLYHFEDDSDPFAVDTTYHVWPPYNVTEDSSGVPSDTNWFEHTNNTLHQESREVSVLENVDEETHDVVDTLIVQVFNSDQLSFGTSSVINEDTMLFATPQFDRDLLMAREENASITKRIELTADDYYDLGQQFEQFEVMFDEPLQANGRAVAAVVTYKTNIPYSEGDTIIDFTGSENVYNLNTFAYPRVRDGFYHSSQAGYDQQGIENDLRLFNSYNGMLFLNKFHRYQAIQGAEDEGHILHDTYLPGQVFGFRYALIAPMDFMMSYDEDDVLYTSIDERETASFEMNSAYPNPVSQGSSFNIEIGSEQAGDVEVEVYDLVGKKVAGIKENNLTPGSHNIEVSTEGWNKGVYLYSVKVNGEQQTRRIVVN